MEVDDSKYKLKRHGYTSQTMSRYTYCSKDAELSVLVSQTERLVIV